MRLRLQTALKPEEDSGPGSWPGVYAGRGSWALQSFCRPAGLQRVLETGRWARRGRGCRNPQARKPLQGEGPETFVELDVAPLLPPVTEPQLEPASRKPALVSYQDPLTRVWPSKAQFPLRPGRGKTRCSVRAQCDSRGGQNTLTRTEGERLYSAPFRAMVPSQKRRRASSSSS